MDNDKMGVILLKLNEMERKMDRVLEELGHCPHCQTDSEASSYTESDNSYTESDDDESDDDDDEVVT